MVAAVDLGKQGHEQDVPLQFRQAEQAGQPVEPQRDVVGGGLPPLFDPRGQRVCGTPVLGRVLIAGRRMERVAQVGLHLGLGDVHHAPQMRRLGRRDRRTPPCGLGLDEQIDAGQFVPQVLCAVLEGVGHHIRLIRMVTSRSPGSGPADRSPM